MELALALKVLDLVLAGADAFGRATAVRSKLQQFQAEGRDPTEAEWSELFASIDTDSARIDAADDRLRNRSPQ